MTRVRPHAFAATARTAIGVLAAILLWVFAPGAPAHDIPADVRINAFLRPAADRLEFLIRVPLAAMGDVDIPTRGPGYLDIARADEALHHAARLWLIDNIDIYADGVRLPTPRIAAARVSLPSDRTFNSYERARAQLEAPRLADNLDLYWNQQLMDVLLEYPIPSDRAQFAIDLRVDRLGMRVMTALRFLPPGGAVRAYEFQGNVGLVYLDPNWFEAARSFVAAGFRHILGGTDHLLFLLSLVIPFRRLRPLVVIVTAFTVGHSLSLIATAFGFGPEALWFPPLVETLIAATILYTAIENIVGSNVERRWILAFAFGLVHGFGFSFALRDSLQFAGDHLVASLFAFNLGVEIGQLAVLIVLVPALDLLLRYVVPERLGVIILSALVAHTAWHWMTERGEQLMKFPLPRIDAAFLASAMRGLMAVLVLAALVWLAHGAVRRWMKTAA